MADLGPKKAGDAATAQAAIESFQRDFDEEVEQDGFKQFAKLAQSLARLRAGMWSVSKVRQLMSLLDKAMTDAETRAEMIGANNPYAIMQLKQNLRQQMRQILMSLEPPAEIIDSEEFQLLMEKVNPRIPKYEKSEYSSKSMMQGKVRSDVLNRQVNESVQEAARRALARVKQARQGNEANPALKKTEMTLMHLARMLKKKRKKKKGAVEDASEVEESAYELTIEDAEELAAMGLEMMRVLREEMAPEWAPDQQPWFLNAADNEVFSIILGAVPKELFEETQAFGDMQNLRTGDEVFTLRAADKTADAVSRKK